ncbi:MAG: hypothetical protein AAF529_20270, partial [Pseudomonadota bacterium]
RGLLVVMGPGRTVCAPVAPGLYRDVDVARYEPVALDTPVVFPGPGVLALDGDRDIQIPSGESLQVVVRRDGSYVINIEAAMRWAVASGMMSASVQNV